MPGKLRCAVCDAIDLTCEHTVPQGDCSMLSPFEDNGQGSVTVSVLDLLRLYQLKHLGCFPSEARDDEQVPREHKSEEE